MCECCGGDCKLVDDITQHALIKIENILDKIITLVKLKMPYEEWPEELKIAGRPDELLGPIDLDPK